MCGRITQKSPPDDLRLTIIMGTPDDPRVLKVRETEWVPRYNGAPGQEHWVIRQNHKTGGLVGPGPVPRRSQTF